MSFGSDSSVKRTGSASRRALATASSANSGKSACGRAKQAVADLKAVIEKTERPIPGERGQPQRQARELHGHRVEINPVQTPLGNGSADGDALGVADVAGEAPAGFDERALVGIRQVSARRHEERAAAHRGIDDAELQDAIGRHVSHQGTERAPYEVLGHGLRGVERPGGLADARSRFEGDRRSVPPAGRRRCGTGFVVEQRFVHGAELLDAEVTVCDAFAPRSIG